MEFPKEFEFKGQWIPVTPIKPNPTRRPPPAIPEPNWAQSMDVNGGELRRLVANGGGGLAQMPYGGLPPTSQPPPISEPNWVQSVEFNGGELGRLVGNGGDGLAQMLPFMRPQPSAISGPNWVQTMDVNGRRLGGNGEGLAHQMQYRRLLAVADPASAGKMNLPPLLADQISERNSGGELNFESSNRNLLLLNGMMFPSMAPKPQYDLPVVPPFLPNLNSLPGNNTAFSVVSEGLATPATPAVMEKNWRERGSELQLPHDIIDLVNEVDSYPDVQNQQNESATLQQSIEAEGWNSSQNQQNESATLQQSIGVEGWNSSQQQEGERMNNVAINTGEENQGIDLNRTPQQKPRRKKYTPKVIRERKPKRTPKAAATPRTAETEATPPNSTGKRKYVRKKKEPNPEEAPPSNITPVEANGNADSRSRSKSVRRSLNFDLEHSQEIDRSVFRQNNLETQTQAREEVHAAVETAVNSSQREGLVGLESSPGCGIGFDLNSSTNQFANETSIRIPQTPIRPTQPGRQEEFMKAKFRFEFSRMISKLSPTMEQETRKEEILKKLASKINCVDDIAGNQSNNSVNGQYQVDSHEASDVQLRGAKRNHNFTDVAQVLSHPSIIHGCNGIDRVHGNNNNTSSNSNPYLSEINKKRRMEDGQKECISNSSTSLTYNPCSGWRTIDSSRNVSQVITFADAQRLMVLRKRQALQQMLMFNQTEREKNKIFRNQSLTSHGALSSSYNKVSTPIGTSDHVNQPLTPEKPPRHSDNNQENEIYGPQARINVLIANQMKSNTRGRKKKEQIPPVNSTASNSSQIEHVSEAFETAPQNLSQKRTHLQSSLIQKCQNDSSSRGSASPGFLSSKALNSYSDPVDEIVRRLMHLNINSECLQNAVVPYAGGSGMMVPFQGPFDIVKKRKPRPKVDLDPESNRVWNLLMGKESSEGAQGTEADKEKWWEEERRVFRGRVDSFIARMHLIQGDRRFSRWKGSVVDSVIGVFLTQNVSDHLSSSAFMCLAARFPPRSNAKDNNENNVETISRSVAINDTISWQGKVSVQELCEGTHKTEKVGNSNDSPQSNDSVAVNIEGRNVGSMKEHSLDYFYGRELGGIIGNESPDSASGSAVTVTSCTSAIEGEDRRSVEDVVSSQNSVASSHNSSEWASHTFNPLNTEAPVSIIGGMGNGSSSFMELLHMAGNQRISTTEFGGGGINCSVPNGNGLPDYVNGSGASIYTSSNSQLYQNQYDFTSLSCAPTPSYYYNSSSNSRFVGKENGDVINKKGCESHLPYTTLGMNETNINDMMKRQSRFISGSSTNSMDKNNLVAPEVTSRVDSSLPICKNSTETVVHSGTGISFEKNHSCCQSETSSNKIISNTSFLHQQDGHAVINNQQKKEAARTQAQIANIGTQTCLNLHDDHQRVDAAESNVRNDVCTSQKVSTNGTFNDTSKKTKKVKPETEKKSYDWDSLRKKTCQDGVLKKERSMDNIDSLDYEALRRADVNEISNAIRERGMNNMLAERIKAFLDRLVSDHGSIDLEWLRDVPPDKAKDYLLSIRGLGLKSVECVRLLTLHHLAFPVDTNVGRICVRLGWVPLQPLPESLQLHLLEMYPILETIQKYLWPRLCKLDQRTLYELHYQLITFGKVFCTKSKPNCNACPMRGECKHFASAFASARLALPGPEEKGLVRSESPISSESGPHNLAHNPMPMPLPPQLEGSTTLSHGQSVPRNCEPIIEEPASPEPEPECIETSEIDIEDAFYNDPDEIPTIKLNFDEFTQNLQNYFQENNVDLQDGDMSKAIVAITPEVASIPMPKLKNVNRLRTEHLVYELPDSHLLLEGMDKREPGDPCPYLLAIWTPGETAQSIEPPKACCTSQNTGQLCDKTTCFNCNSIREAQAQTVRGTLLIPCRTANRGSFPLNGTYFQVNEVFADHDSSCNPIDVPRDWIWNLPRRTVYFGTSIPSIFKGLTTEGIQHCFWRGFVCVRGFDRTSRAPKPLFARLHFPASKTTGNKRTATTAGNNE